MFKKVLKPFFQNNFLLFLILVVGSISWSLVMFKSGLVYPFGMGFWGANGHDGVWHIAIINSLAKGSWQMPVFAGEVLRNYHFGFDLVVAALFVISKIPIQNLYFQVIPPLLAIAIGGLTYLFVKQVSSKSSALWSVFFVYFGGSLGWLVTLVRTGEIGGESMFWAQQAVSTLINPPFALSLLILLLGLILLTKLEKGLNTVYFLIVIFLFGLVGQVKVYAGILVICGLFVLALYSFLKDKKVFHLKIFLGASLVFVITLFPFLKNSSNFLILNPFWFLETMMGLSDRFYWPKFYEAMVNYRLGNIWLKGGIAYFVAFIIFWYGNLGTRAVSEIVLAKWLLEFKKLQSWQVFIGTIIFLGVLIPLAFVQKGTPWNTIQFFYYSLFFLALLGGIGMEVINKKINLKARIISSCAIVFFTLPTTISTLWSHYLPARPPTKLSHAELAALDFLSKEPEGIILTYPFDKQKAKEALIDPPRPLYLYESTAYVSAFSGKSVYLEDEVNLEITGYNWQERREKVENFLQTADKNVARLFLIENSISYIYWIKGQRALLGEGQLGLVKIFENEEVDIYKVVK